MLGGEIRNQIPEPVHVDNLADQGVVFPMWLRDGTSPILFDNLPVGLKRFVLGEPRSGRAKEIPPIEGVSRRFTPKLLLVDLPHFNRLFVLKYVGEYTVVRAQKKVPRTFDGN